MKLNGLILSPVLPQQSGQGNRARVYDLSTQLSKFSNLHLLYYLYETVKEAEYTFDKFEDIRNIFKLILPVVPTVSIQPPPKNNQFHEVDEWWDPVLEGTLKYLSNNFKYDFVLVNYVWLSKALEFFPNSVVKLIDSHDKFTERDLVYRKIGTNPEFFYTNTVNEAKGLARANVVIGIQELDSQYFKKISSSEVVTIPHINEELDFSAFSEERIKSNLIRVGMLGVANQVNITSFNKFIKFFETRNVGDNFKIIAAGSVCDHLIDSRVLTKIGYVENLDSFFKSIDIFVNPVEYSTGQKIKLADAIYYECPFVSTDNGSEGLPVKYEVHKFNNIESLVNFFFSSKIDDDFILKMKEETKSLKARIIKLRQSSFNAIRNSIFQNRKITVLFLSFKNLFYSNELILERMLALRNSLSGSSIVQVVVEDVELVKLRDHSDVLTLDEFLKNKEILMIDTLVVFGGLSKKLQDISRRIVYDGLSLISNDGKVQLAHRSNYFYSKKIANESKLIQVPVDLKFTYSKLKSTSAFKIYILASSYHDFMPRVFKKILQKKCPCEIVLPHQIKSYETIDRYHGVIDNCLGIIVMDGTDRRYDLLKDLCYNSSIPSFVVNTFLDSLAAPILSSKLFLIIASMPNLFKSTLDKRVDYLKKANFWQLTPGLWDFIRS